MAVPHPPPTAYVKARLLDPASGLDAAGALLVVGGQIADLGPHLFAQGVPSGMAVVDCQGHCLAPGLIDLRVNLREPGEEHKETIKTASLAAAAGGVTTMAALPNSDPVVDDVAGLEFVARRARDVKLVKIYSYGTITRRYEGRELTEFGLLKDYGAVGFTDGIRPVADAQVMRRALSYSRAFDQVVVQTPQEPSLSGGVMNSGELSTRLGLAGISPMAEVIMLERDLRLAEMTGGRYHAALISTAESVEVLRRAKRRGITVTCDTAPHYFTLNELAVGDYRSFAKVMPPLRSEADRQAIVAGLADGTIDAIASDHSPHDQDSKRLPFAQAAFGIVGLESLLPLSLAPVHRGEIGMLELLAKLTCGPAAALRLPGGRLQMGAPADLVLFDPEHPWRLDPDAFLSKSKNSPFEGHLVQGKVLRTVVDGRSIYAADAGGP